MMTELFGIAPTREDYTCFYCGHYSNKVEARGLWYCPNLLCSGPGAAWFRAKLKSFKEINFFRHTVDPEEWREEAFRYLQDNPGRGHFLAPEKGWRITRVKAGYGLN